MSLGGLGLRYVGATLPAACADTWAATLHPFIDVSRTLVDGVRHLPPGLDTFPPPDTVQERPAMQAHDEF